MHTRFLNRDFPCVYLQIYDGMKNKRRLQMGIESGGRKSVWCPAAQKSSGIHQDNQPRSVRLLLIVLDFGKYYTVFPALCSVQDWFWWNVTLFSQVKKF